MPKVQQKHGISRQRPVSCQFCRTRKLRCSRTAPCTNCVSRGIACDLEQSFPQPGGASNSSSAESTEIYDRLRRLENLLDQQAGAQGSSGGTSEIEATEPRFAQHSASSGRNQAVDADCDTGILQSINLNQIPSVSCSGINSHSSSSPNLPCPIHPVCGRLVPPGILFLPLLMAAYRSFKRAAKLCSR